VQCHGARPGRLDGPVKLVTDSRTQRSGGRLRLWLGADGVLQLTYEQVGMGKHVLHHHWGLSITKCLG